jgi:hypothetical protein
MNKYLPSENIILKTKLNKEQAISKLNENIEAEKSFGFGAHNHNYSKPYIGQINGNSFEVKRAISYRNSFLPIIKGEVLSESDSIKVSLNMKPHSFVVAFMALWLSGAAFGCIVSTFALFTQEFTPFFLIPFGMLIFGIALILVAFKAESAISKKDFVKILEAEIE